MKTNKKTIISALIVVVFILAFYGFIRLTKNTPTNSGSTASVVSDDQLIHDFLLSGPGTIAYHDKGKWFCSSKKMWEKNISAEEKVVFSDTFCGSVFLSNSIPSIDGGGGGPSFFLFKNTGSSWIVADYDESTTPDGISSKNWVNTYLPLATKAVKDDTFWSDGSSDVEVTKQASQYYGVPVPKDGHLLSVY